MAQVRRTLAVVCLVVIPAALALLTLHPHPSQLSENPVSSRQEAKNSIQSLLLRGLPREQKLVPWHGPVEHLFFHTLVVRPELAFYNHPGARGLRDYMVTAREFRGILQQMWENNWTLVDLHRAVAGTVFVPLGRRPFVLSEDDVNYYDYSRPHGQAWRLVLDATGAVKAEVRDDRGVRMTDDDVVPIVEDFVARHPEFSAQGARGVLALTGYEGLFGERLGPHDPAGLLRAKAIARTLRASGWSFANHTWGHIDLRRAYLGWIQDDLQRWKALAEPVVGKTDVLVYPFGSRPTTHGAQFFQRAGYTIQLDIDVVPRLVREQGWTLMSRRHIDGIAFRDAATRLAPFFSVARVWDPQRPTT